MKSPLEAPANRSPVATAKAETQSVIDTSKMSAGKAAALDLAESSRDPLDERGSFASNLFHRPLRFRSHFSLPGAERGGSRSGRAFP